MLSTDYYPSIAAASILTSDPQFRHVLFIGGYMLVSQATIGQYINKPENIPSNTAQVLAETSKFLTCP
jgi:hypothetical protein